MNEKPALFIGSSTEALDLARSLEEHLSRDARVALWTNDVFRPGSFPIYDLMREVGAADFACLLALGEDVTRSRGKQQRVPRDNVVFEAGLFMGSLGPGRTFLLHDSAAKAKLPSDLFGLTAVEFDGTRTGDGVIRALGPAANVIRRTMARLGPRSEESSADAICLLLPRHPDLTRPTGRLLSQHLPTLLRELEALSARGEIRQYAEVALRIHDTFRLAGNYDAGIEVGDQLADILQQLGETAEARWIRLNMVSYLHLLNGDYRSARATIESILAVARGKSSECVGMRIRAHRLLATTFMRDPLKRDLVQAQIHLQQALDEAERLRISDPPRWESLMAGIELDLGDLAWETQRTSVATGHYEAALGHLSNYDLNDHQELARANLKLGRVRIGAARTLAELDSAEDLIRRAEELCILFQWHEGLAEVYEQFANATLVRARRSRGRNREQLLQSALGFADKAAQVLGKTSGRQGRERIDSLRDRILGLVAR